MAARTVPPGLIAAAELLACPVCRSELALAERRLVCPAGHSFDAARQGHVNLLRRAAPANADTAEMVAARQRFLGAGWYQPVVDAVVAALDGASTVLEAGAGTGHYVGAYLDSAPHAVGLATDISPQACRVAARRSPRLGAVVADTWAGLPVRSRACDAVLCVFAPRNPAEFARVLRPGGRLVVVTPSSQHLSSLRLEHGLLSLEADKLTRLDATMAEFFLTHRQHLTHHLELNADAARDLIAMGPNAFHGHTAIQALTTVAAFTISSFTLPTPM